MYISNSIINSNIKFISAMPRLKKYSQIYGDDLSSGVSVGNVTGRAAPHRISELSNTNGNTRNNKSNKQSQSDDISSDNQQSNTNKQDANKRYSQNNLKNNRNSNQSDNQKGQNKRTERKRVSKNKQGSGKYNADQILKKMQEQCAKEQEQYQYQQKDENQTNVQIPGDVFVGVEKKKRCKSNKKDKSGVKIQNKFFNNLEITQFQDYRQQSSLTNQANPNKNLSEFQRQQLQKMQEQQKQIQALKNQKALQMMNQRKNQLQQKVSRIRGRLDFKNAHDDVRFKEHFKQTLDNVRDCQQVDIMIQAPKIFKGSSAKQTDAALFIKNMAMSGHQSQHVQDHSNVVSRALSRQKDQKEDKNKKIGRKQFYEQFTRQVKQNKAVQFPVVTNCIFKKTSLDQLQYEKNEHLFKQDSNMRNSMTNKSLNQRSSSNVSIQNKERTSIDKQKQKQRQRQRQNSNSKSISANVLKNTTKQTKLIKIIQQSKQEESSKPLIKEIIAKAQPIENKQQQKRIIEKKNEGRSKSKGKSNKKQSKQKQTQENQKKSKQKQNKDKNKNKKAKKKKRSKQQKFDDQIKALFQQQAQDQSNGYGDNNGQSSESDDNDSVQQIIDRKKVKIVQKYEREARKKYRNDIDKRDEEIVQKIKERILYPRKIKCEYDQSSQSRQRRIQRMEQARKKFEQEDGVDDDKLEQCTKQQENKEYVKEEDIFQKHLKQLEQQQRANGQTLKPKKNKSKNKSGNAWKQMRVFTKVESLNASGVNKRGGFINNDQSKVTGHKINNNNKNKKASKEKNINF